MKLTKISLAALVALGAFSSVASATPLEEAIKNVDLSGFARYRYTDDHFDNKGAKTTNANHRFRIESAFKAAIDDNFFGVLNLLYDTKDGSGHMTPNATDQTNTTGSFGVQEFYLGYKYGNTTVTAGKQLIKTFFDDGDISGTGVKILNTDVPGLTLTAAAYDALEYDTVDVDGPLLNAIGAMDKSPNLYLLGAMGSYDPVAFKIWYANIHDIANLIAGDAAVNFNINDFKLGLQGQYAHNESDHADYTDANFYGVKANFGILGASLNAGYINFKADNTSNGGVGTSFVSIDSNGGYINPAKILNGAMSSSSQFYNNIKDKNDYWFINAKYVFDQKYGIGAGYTKGKGYSNALAEKRAKRDEWYGQLDYKYSKKLNFMAWYAAAKDKKDGEKYKQDRIRFEAKYSF